MDMIYQSPKRKFTDNSNIEKTHYVHASQGSSVIYSPPGEDYTKSLPSHLPKSTIKCPKPGRHQHSTDLKETSFDETSFVTANTHLTSINLKSFDGTKHSTFGKGNDVANESFVSSISNNSSNYYAEDENDEGSIVDMDDDDDEVHEINDASAIFEERDCTPINLVPNANANMELWQSGRRKECESTDKVYHNPLQRRLDFNNIPTNCSEFDCEINEPKTPERRSNFNELRNSSKTKSTPHSTSSNTTPPTVETGKSRSRFHISSPGDGDHEDLQQIQIRSFPETPFHDKKNDEVISGISTMWGHSESRNSVIKSNKKHYGSLDNSGGALDDDFNMSRRTIRGQRATPPIKIKRFEVHNNSIEGLTDSSQLSLTNRVLPDMSGFEEPSSSYHSNISQCPPTPDRHNSFAESPCIATRIHRQNSLEETKLLVDSNDDMSDNGDTENLNFYSYFKVIGYLGGGNFAEVYKVERRKDQQQFAVKKLKTAFRNSKERQNLLTEIVAMKLLNSCDNIIHFYRAWQEDYHIYVQEELASRGTLTDLMIQLSRRGIPFPDSTLWRIIHNIANGLNAIHSHGVVHMDIKPQNILIDINGTLKIGDFGIAVIKNRSDSKAVVDSSEGDDRYFAKEVMGNNDERHPSADIFSFGIMLYEITFVPNMIQLPSNGLLWQSLRLEGNYPPIINRPSSIVNLINHMMKKEPLLRISSSDILKMPHITSIDHTIPDPILISAEEVQCSNVVVHSKAMFVALHVDNDLNQDNRNVHTPEISMDFTKPDYTPKAAPHQSMQPQLETLDIVHSTEMDLSKKQKPFRKTQTSRKK